MLFQRLKKRERDIADLVNDPLTGLLDFCHPVSSREDGPIKPGEFLQSLGKPRA